MWAALGDITLASSLLLAWVLVAYGFLAGQKELPQRLLVHGFHLLTAGVVLSSLLLLGALLSSDFSLRYVWMYTNRTLDPVYKLAAFWGGQEGSLLFWCLIQGLCSSLAVCWLQKAWRGQPAKRLHYVIAIFAAIQLFFHCVMFFAENPFATLGLIPSDGRGLNPLLQTWSMIIHPPCLYLGYILCSLPFAITLATLMSGPIDSRWIRQTRTATLLAWFFLSAGNLLGAHWAYNELGWGGFWAWDPVENAAIMPWFTTTAYLHSVMVQERRGILKAWNFTLVSISFCLTILGTFITRSGLISSVHTFAKSNLGYFFLAFLLLCIFFCLYQGWRHRHQLKSEHGIDSLLSKESSFILNNILLTISAFAILWGTLFPIFSEWLTGNKITVGPPYFNSFMVPMALGLLFLMGMGQTLAWGKTAHSKLVRLFFWPALAALLAAITCYLLDRSHGGMGNLALRAYVLGAWALAAFVLTSIIQEWVVGTRTRQRAMQENIWQAWWRLTLAARRRFGGYIVHCGFLLIVIGIIGVAFKQETEIHLQRGESTTLGQYQIRLLGLHTSQDAHKEAVQAQLEISTSDRASFILTPARYFYRGNEKMGNSGEPQSSTEIDIASTWQHDLYTVLHTFNWQKQSASLLLTINPLVNWLWAGGLVIVMGTLFLLWPIPSQKLTHAGTLQAIREIDFDLKMDKIESSDHAQMRKLLAKQAQLPSVYEELRRETQTELQNQLAQMPTPIHGTPPFCRQCQMPFLPEHHYCQQCGSRLS